MWGGGQVLVLCDACMEKQGLTVENAAGVPVARTLRIQGTLLLYAPPFMLLAFIVACSCH